MRCCWKSRSYGPLLLVVDGLVLREVLEPREALLEALRLGFWTRYFDRREFISGSGYYNRQSRYCPLVI
jgi:hypothetical protein